MNTVQRSPLVDPGGKQRSMLTFSVEGLAAREELLFKGYVRLLDHLTEHHWQYREPSAVQRIDLLVADERVQPTRCFQAAEKLQPVLQLGTTQNDSNPFFLAWPLKPYELENKLNRLGRLIGAGTANGPAPAEQKSIPESKLAAPAQKHYRLRQWPKPSLLTEPGSMRLATLLTGRAMGLDELVFRSALAPQVCERFVAAMQAADLIMHPDVYGIQPAPWKAPTIKQPVATASNKNQASETNQVNQPTVKSSAQPGLLARIRMRFGIKA